MLIPIWSSASRVSARIWCLRQQGHGPMDLLALEEHVLGDVELVDQREVLVDAVDAERPGMVDVAEDRPPRP